MAAHTTKTITEAVPRRVFSPSEARAYLACSDELLMDLRTEGEITWYKYKGRVWYDVKSIDQFLNRCKQ